MMRARRTGLCFALALALVPGGAARAVEVAGVEFPARIEVAPAAATLVLSGAGVRRAFLFDVYAIGLYLPARAPSAEAAIAAPGRKRVVIHMLRDVSAQDFTDALAKNLRANHDEAAMRALAPSVARFEAIFTAQGVVRKGTRVALDLVPGTGTVVAVDGAQGEPIPDEDFFRALLRNWLGLRPVSTDLKRELLGAP